MSSTERMVLPTEQLAKIAKDVTPLKRLKIELRSFRCDEVPQALWMNVYGKKKIPSAGIFVDAGIHFRVSKKTDRKEVCGKFKILAKKKDNPEQIYRVILHASVSTKIPSFDVAMGRLNDFLSNSLMQFVKGFLETNLSYLDIEFPASISDMSVNGVSVFEDTQTSYRFVK